MTTKTWLLAFCLCCSAIWLQAQSQYPQTGSSQNGSDGVGRYYSTGLSGKFERKLHAYGQEWSDLPASG
jgi:hypothetical protein